MSLKDRIETVLASYAHGLENAAPRVASELAELKFLLGVGPDPVPTPEAAKEAADDEKADLKQTGNAKGEPGAE